MFQTYLDPEYTNEWPMKMCIFYCTCCFDTLSIDFESLGLYTLEDTYIDVNPPTKCSASIPFRIALEPSGWTVVQKCLRKRIETIVDYLSPIQTYQNEQNILGKYFRTFDFTHSNNPKHTNIFDVFCSYSLVMSHGNEESSV